MPQPMVLSAEPLTSTAHWMLERLKSGVSVTRLKGRSRRLPREPPSLFRSTAERRISTVPPSLSGPGKQRSPQFTGNLNLRGARVASPQTVHWNAQSAVNSHLLSSEECVLK